MKWFEKDMKRAKLVIRNGFSPRCSPEYIELMYVGENGGELISRRKNYYKVGFFKPAQGLEHDSSHMSAPHSVLRPRTL